MVAEAMDVQDQVEGPTPLSQLANRLRSPSIWITAITYLPQPRQGVCWSVDPAFEAPRLRQGLDP